MQKKGKQQKQGSSDSQVQGSIVSNSPERNVFFTLDSRPISKNYQEVYGEQKPAFQTQGLGLKIESQDKLQNKRSSQIDKNGVTKTYDTFQEKLLNYHLIDKDKREYSKVEKSKFYMKKQFDELQSHQRLLENKSSDHSLSSHGSQYGKNPRDTKNAVKNIFKLFNNWILEKPSSSLHLTEALVDCRGLNGKYNNSLIIKISKIPELRKAFLLFSQQQGADRIGKSKIQDKQTHLYALSSYRSVCQMEEEKLLNLVDQQVQTFERQVPKEEDIGKSKYSGVITKWVSDRGIQVDQQQLTDKNYE